ncbi:MAG TPA: 4-(cytidine 5'-diphospho)-2-C-methyl-D-erythritol kinase [Candidatus Acidoferrales bacterium]|nr:4-(cytidine 5'-diphospho)-2-C-methyl-D-erythritol kinase [Candidatus Acidoferrales bacterium]
MKLLAPAKINIGLRVIRKRSDTYHDIETVFYPIHLADELEIIESDKHEFYSNIHLEADANLCLKALHFFCERTGINAEVKMVLNKNIPIGSGLGGGSSDAAAVLLALQELYGKPLCEIELHDIAVQLGADVPFFLSRKNASGNRAPSYATGKGEVIEPIDLNITDFILTVTPNLSVSTATAYSLVKPTGVKRKLLRDVLLDLGNRYDAYKDVVVNDFETEILKKFPTIGEIKAEMYKQGAQFALMSGSGSSIYGFFGTKEDAIEAQEILNRKFTLQATDITPPHN